MVIASIINWMRQNPLIVLLFLIGAVVRCAAAGGIPPGLNQDEASIGYEAYSILHEGVDRNGNFYPVHLIAWGSGQNALYAYLSMPFIFAFGLNVFSVRIVSLLFGLLGLILFYSIAKALFQSERGAALAAFFIVINPWHIMMSRWALESNLFPTLALLAVWFVIKAAESSRSRWLYGFTIAMGMSLYAYGTAYFFVPLFAAAVYVLLLAKRLFTARAVFGQGVLLILLAVPIALFVLINRYDWPAISIGPITIPKLTVPRVEEVSSVFSGGGLNRLLEHFNSFLQLLVSQNDGLPWNVIPSFGMFYPLALPLALLGIIPLVKQLASRFSLAPAIIGVWLLVTAIMASMTDVNINRINIVFFPVIMLAAAGLLWLGNRVKGLVKAAVCVFAFLFAAFCSSYFTEFPDKISPSFYESFGEAIVYASAETDGAIYVTNAVNMPYIYVLFYEQISPHEYRDTVVYSNPGAAFQQVTSFGRYKFGTPAIADGENAAYIFHNSSVPDSDGLKVKVFKHYTVIVHP